MWITKLTKELCANYFQYDYNLNVYEMYLHISKMQTTFKKFNLPIPDVLSSSKLEK